METSQYSNKRIGILSLIISALCFGLMPIFAKFAYVSGITVPTLLSIRFFISAAILFACLVIMKKGIRISPKQLIQLILLGGVCYTLQSFFYFMSVARINVSIMAPILYIYPAMVAPASAFLYKKGLSLRTLLTVVMSLGGLWLMMGASGAWATADGLGVAYAAGTAVVFSAYLLLSQKVMRDINMLLASAYVMLFTGIGQVILGLWQNNLSLAFSGDVWLPLAGIVIFSTILGISLQLKGIGCVGSTKAAIISLLEPLFSITLSVLLFADSMSLLQAVGAVVMLSATIVTALPEESKKLKNTENASAYDEMGG